jgi:dipeptidyl aminopeptidase/acylaminoacyl peptidase
MRRLLVLLLSFCLAGPTLDETPRTKDLTAAVTRMARVGRAFSPTFSPDGKRLAFVSDLSGVPQVWVMPSDGGFPTMVTSGDDPVSEVKWSPTSDELAFTVAPGGGMNSQIYIARSDGTGLRRLTAGGRDNNWLADWTRDGRHLMVASSVRDPAAVEPYLLDPKAAQMQPLASGEGITQLVSVSRDGRRGFLERLKSRGDNDLYLVDISTRKQTLLTPHTPPGEFSGEISPDGDVVYVSSNKDRDLQAFGRIKLNERGDPSQIEVLAERPDAELDGFELNEQGTAAVLVWNVGGKSSLEFIDLRTSRRTPGPTLPSELVFPGAWSRDGGKIALVASGSAAPTDVWVYELKSKNLRQVTFSPHPGVDLSALVHPELVKFRAHDGLELSGWLYRPLGQSAPGAYVVSFHGGPEGQERPAFRADYQAFLLEGIGVFAPNVRGSSGFGKKFVNLDNGPLRVNGVKDIKSCVDYLVENHIADPKRIGITGGSYGGYMTMAGVTEFPDLFAAGVDLFGIVNFATFFEHTEPWMAAISTTEYGDPKTQADLLKQLSPIYKLDRIKAAMMIQHGANDTNVPVVEAEQIVNNLKARGVPVEYVLFPDEGHGWRKVSNRIRSVVASAEFFSKNLNPEPTDPGK